MTDLETSDIEIIMDMLTGSRLPDGVSMDMPELDRKTAFSVIWFLQEIVRIIPANFEMCDNCQAIYDTDRGGYTTSADEYAGSWYEQSGVTKAQVQAQEGSNFCDDVCELLALTRVT